MTDTGTQTLLKHVKELSFYKQMDEGPARDRIEARYKEALKALREYKEQHGN